MTTPAPPVTTASFQGVLHPADVARILNLLLSEAPLANILSRYPTSRSTVAFPTAKPDRPSWLAEFDELPVIGLGDAAAIVGVVKLASILLVANEAVSDSSVNITAEFTQLIRDSASTELDRGICYGEGAPEPAGLVAAALPAAGDDLGAAITAAIGSMGDAGGQATHLCARPSVLAAARDLRDANGVQLHPDGIGPGYGLAEVGVPELRADDVLVIDKTRTWLIVRNDFQVDQSGDAFFQRDAWALRLRGRFAVAAPDLPKSLRRLELGDGSTRKGARTQPVVAKS
jgi:HK97 family phage major capsid protein